MSFQGIAVPRKALRKFAITRVAGSCAHPVDSRPPEQSMIDSDSEVSRVGDYLQGLQARIVDALEDVDGRKTFTTDRWKREAGGGGTSRVLKGVAVFEQAGVGCSHVFGDTLPESATRARPELSGHRFQALGISLVLHPRNPHVPTTHANFRFFKAG